MIEILLGLISSVAYTAVEKFAPFVLKAVEFVRVKADSLLPGAGQYVTQAAVYLLNVGAMALAKYAGYGDPVELSVAGIAALIVAALPSFLASLGFHALKPKSA